MNSKPKSKKVLKLIFALLLLVGLIFAALNTQAIGKSPFDGYTAENISYICSDNLGGKVIIDNSGYEVVHINADNHVDGVITGNSTAQDSFYFALSVCCDNEGNIYVHSKELSLESSFSISREYIRKFSPTGEFLETVVDIPHDESVMKCDIFRMQYTDNGFSYYTLSDDAVVMHTKKQSGSEFEQTDISYPQASEYVRDALYSGADDSLYIVTYDGLVGKISSGVFTELYNAPLEDSLSVPWYISLDSEDSLYVCDIGYRTINKLSADGYECVYFNYEYTSDYDPSGRYDSYTQYVADFSNGFMAVNSDELIWDDGGELSVNSTFEYESSITASIYVFWAAAILAGAAILFFIVLGVISMIKSNSATVRMSAIVIALTFTVAGLFIGLTFGNFNDRILDEMHEREDDVALALDNTLPKDSFLALNNLSAYGGEDYMAVKKSVDSLLIDENGDAGDLYCVLYSINDGVITIRYTLEEAFGINYPYDWDYIDSDEEYIMTTGEKLFYSSLDNSEGNFMFILNPMFDDDGNVIGLIEIGTNLTAFSETNNELIRNLLINILVMSIVLIMIAVEAIAFINSRKKLKGLLLEGNPKKVSAERANLLRVIVFLVFFVTNITTCFLSYYALTLAQNGNTFLNLPPEILAAFPISAEVLTGAVFSVCGSFFIRKLGRRNAGILGGILFTVGLCVRFINVSLLTLTIGNAIQGCGWGIVLLIINTMIAEESESGSSQDGFVNYNAALQNGMNSGIVFGGFLINWMSYRSILIFSAALSVLVLVLAAMYFTKDKLSVSSDNEGSSISLGKFLTRPKVLLYFVGIVLPVIAAGYYLNYLYPIIGEQLGMNETYLGYSYLLNGLVVICFGNLIVRKLSRRLSRPAMMLMASAIYFIAFLLVGRYQNVTVLLIALLALGISDSFGYATQTSYYSELEEVKRFGYSRSMGIYSLFENIAQTAGSFIFGYVLVVGLEKGLTMFGLLIIALAIIFSIGAFASNSRAKKRIKSSGNAAVEGATKA